MLMKFIAPLLVFASAATPSVTPTLVQVAPQVQLRVIDVGTKTGRPPLVLIPGWSTSADIWLQQIAAFSADRRVIAIDPRSQGESSKVAAGNTPETRAEDLQVVLRDLAVERPVLIGWSQGVQDVAAYIAKFGSTHLTGIVLVDSTASHGARGITASPKNAVMTFERLALYQEHQEEYLRGMFGFIISKPQTPSAIAALVSTGLKTPPAIGAAMLVADLYGVDRSEAFHSVRVPVLVIAAGKSPELEAQRTMARQIPGAQFEVVENASHAVFLDQPELFRVAVEKFLGGLSRTNAGGRRAP